MVAGVDLLRGLSVHPNDVAACPCLNTVAEQISFYNPGSWKKLVHCIWVGKVEWDGQARRSSHAGQAGEMGRAEQAANDQPKLAGPVKQVLLVKQVKQAQSHPDNQFGASKSWQSRKSRHDGSVGQPGKPVKQILLVPQVKQTGPSGQAKQVSLSRVTDKELDGKRMKKAWNMQLENGSDDSCATGSQMTKRTSRNAENQSTTCHRKQLMTNQNALTSSLCSAHQNLKQVWEI